MANLVSKSLTKKEIAARANAKLGLDMSPSEVYRIIQKTVDVIAEALSHGERIVLRNFGTFSIKEVKPKVGRNPKAPENEVRIPARSVVKFRVGKELRDEVAKLKLH